MFKNFILFALIFCVTFFSTSVSAAVGTGKKILYIPIDTRPCNLIQTVEVAKKLGYEVLTPPMEILGSGATLEKFGKPDELWTWLEDNAMNADAAVISTDAMLYGSLVASRQHNLTAEEILNRAEKFAQFKNNFPRLPVYAFATIMRTAREGVKGDSTETEYYAQYGAAIFEYTALIDKQETKGLSRADKKQLAWLDYYIPQDARQDWFARREKNFNANKYFVDLMKAGTFNYLLIGCDDSAIFSQTHKESRQLADYAGNNFSKEIFQVMSGADELGMLMISRAINNDLHEMPFVAIEYAPGTGSETIPAYSNEKISDDLYGAIFAVGGLPIPANERADLVLAVNTRFNGKTIAAISAENSTSDTYSTCNFMRLLNGLLDKNLPVGLVDISCFNGADNSVMEQLRKQDLQFKLRAYGGWNTATNTSGFLIGSGVLTKFMTDSDINNLLLTRYLDDWIYQSNVRVNLQDNIEKIFGNGTNFALDEKLDGAILRATEQVQNFAQKNLILPKGHSLQNISVNFPWQRLFEADVYFDYQ